jgi:hypothetical protein
MLLLLLPPLLQAASASEGRSSSRGGAMAAWDAGDSKRLWHKLVRVLPVRLAESEQQMELKVTVDSGSSFEVGVGHGLSWCLPVTPQ